MHFLGLAGMPRRIPDFPDTFLFFNFISSIGSAISTMSVLLFLYIIFSAFYRKENVFTREKSDFDFLEAGYIMKSLSYPIRTVNHVGIQVAALLFLQAAPLLFLSVVFLLAGPFENEESLTSSLSNAILNVNMISIESCQLQFTIDNLYKYYYLLLDKDDALESLLYEIEKSDAFLAESPGKEDSFNNKLIQKLSPQIHLKNLHEVDHFYQYEKSLNNTMLAKFEHYMPKVRFND